MTNARSKEAQLLLTASTVNSNDVSRNKNQLSQNFENQATQVTHTTTFQYLNNQHSQNVFASLSSNQIPSYNLTPAPHQV